MITRVFVGYDPRQPVAFQTLVHTIWDQASVPVQITRLQLNQLPITRVGLTEFTYSRFLVPYLCGYEGVAVFVDSDFLCRADIAPLLAYPLAYPEHAVFVSQNKLRFEWPSLMVFNNALCKTLTPEYVQTANCFDMSWASSIGDLPNEWNHLVGYDAFDKNAKMIHYTQGIPCWPETKDCAYSAEWKTAMRQTVSTVPFQELMGNSVHAKYVYARLEQTDPKITRTREGLSTKPVGVPVE